MSQKSSVPQAISFVSQVLKGDTSLFSNVEAFSEATMALGSLRGYWSRNCPEHLTSILTVW